MGDIEEFEGPALQRGGAGDDGEGWHVVGGLDLVGADGGQVGEQAGEAVHRRSLRDLEPIPLPLTGSYAILVDPDETNTGSLALTLYDVPPDLVGALTIGGPSMALNTTTPGQNARLTFEGSAGQRVSLGVSEVSFDPGPGPAQVSILNPDGTELAAKLVFDSGDDIDAEPLPQTGTHTVVIDPRRAQTAGLTLTLSEPIAAALTLGGPPVPWPLTGQDRMRG